MKEIKEDLELVEFDGIETTSVYIGFFDDLEKADLKWRKGNDEIWGDEMNVLRLSEIKEQLKGKGLITIFVNKPLSGYILQYGNYGDSWWHIGTLSGYA